jgi:hypothetical protein
LEELRWKKSQKEESMISVDVDSDSMKPGGVPITVMVLRKMKENDERMKSLSFY